MYLMHCVYEVRQVENQTLQNIQLHTMSDVLDALCGQSKKCISLPENNNCHNYASNSW